MRLILDNETMAQEFFEDCLLLGIVAPIHKHTFCWEINQALGFCFRIKHEMEIQLSKKGRDYFFSMYEYKVPNVQLAHYLYKNQHDGEYLLPEVKHFDYLWLIKGDRPGTEVIDALIKSLKKLDGVQLVTEVKTDKIKNKQHLVF
ncbi:MAG TPA: IPExxxVDY family protein [Ferruginibacter sp.]|nr:IPExxxVDY family protein [Ferruginibacter sp.]HMP19958.1 IPExxxVDY family protein [Ferruginibacter sp.]